MNRAKLRALLTAAALVFTVGAGDLAKRTVERRAVEAERASLSAGGSR